MNTRNKRLAFAGGALFVAVFVAGVVGGWPGAVWALTLLGPIVGINTVAYEFPVSGAVAPTAIQSRPHQQVSAVVTGDGAATVFTITHNWGLPAADLTNSFCEVFYEFLLASGYTAAALISSKTTNAVAFTCTAFAGAGLRVRLKRPWTALR
jgi:hypothetical protein